MSAFDHWAMWKQSDWPDERIVEFGDKLSAIITDVEWNWDPAYTAPRFRAFPPGPWTLGLYVDGRWFVEKNGMPSSSGQGESFEVGAKELAAVWAIKRDGKK